MENLRNRMQTERESLLNAIAILRMILLAEKRTVV
jgi:hypothetical protein